MLLNPDQLSSLLCIANKKNENGVNPFWEMMKEYAKAQGIKEEDMSLLHCLTCFFFPGCDAIAMERAYDKMGFENWQAVIAHIDLKTYCRLYDAYSAAQSPEAFLDDHEDGKYYYTSRVERFERETEQDLLT
jgi:hypothetical protein